MTAYAIDLHRDGRWTWWRTFASLAEANAEVPMLRAGLNSYRVRAATPNDPIAIPPGANPELARNLSGDEATILAYVAQRGHVYRGRAADALGNWRDPHVRQRASDALRNLRDKGILSETQGVDYYGRHIATVEGRKLVAALAAPDLATTANKE